MDTFEKFREEDGRKIKTEVEDTSRDLSPAERQRQALARQGEDFYAAEYLKQGKNPTTPEAQAEIKARALAKADERLGRKQKENVIEFPSERKKSA